MLVFIVPLKSSKASKCWEYVSKHICYISDLRKLKAYFPEWQITRSLTDILKEIVVVEQERYANV